MLNKDSPSPDLAQENTHNILTSIACKWRGEPLGQFFPPEAYIIILSNIFIGS